MENGKVYREPMSAGDTAITLSAVTVLGLCTLYYNHTKRVWVRSSEIQA